MSDERSERQGYYAVIPAQVRYDPELRPNAKLLYGELTALAGPDGYCWASDQYFATLYGLSAKTINELIQSLQRRGYIRIEIGSNRRGTERHIYAGTYAVASIDGGMHKNVDTHKNVETPGGYAQKSGEGYAQKSGLHNDNNINITDTPKAPQRGRRVKSAPDWEPEMFERFWRAYPEKGHKDRPMAVREWDKLKPDRALMHRMGEALDLQKASDQWQRGIGIPYAGRWLSHRRWEDAVDLATPCPIQQACGCVQSPEVAEW